MTAPQRMLLPLAVVLLFASLAFTPCEAVRDDDAAVEAFDTFVADFAREYATAEERDFRFSVFKRSLAEIDRLNEEQAKTGGTAKFGVTILADRTKQEFQALLGSRALDAEEREQIERATNERAAQRKGERRQVRWVQSVPETFDWRNTNMVTPVKDQGQCGACWAFSGVETISSAWAIAGNPLTPLSVEQVVSCGPNKTPCDGGAVFDAFNYVIDAGGLESESDFPYTAGNGTVPSCSEGSSGTKVATISGFLFGSSDEKTLAKQLVENGPISITVDASSWQHYQSGVLLSKNCGTMLDHAVVATGFNLSADTPYWAVRNSWSANWAKSQGGYIHLEFGQNTCGLASQPAYVSV